MRTAVSSLFGTKSGDHLVDLDLKFEVERDKTALKRLKYAAPLLSPSPILLVRLACPRNRSQLKCKCRDLCRRLRLDVEGPLLTVSSSISTVDLATCPR